VGPGRAPRAALEAGPALVRSQVALATAGTTSGFSVPYSTTLDSTTLDSTTLDTPTPATTSPATTILGTTILGTPTAGITTPAITTITEAGSRGALAFGSGPSCRCGESSTAYGGSPLRQLC
jgi:hypothetical protein